MSTDRKKTDDDSPGAGGFPLERREFVASMFTAARAEETLIDRRTARYVNADLGEYHVLVNADVPDIDIVLVDERDAIVNPLGAKGIGEIGTVGVAAAVANAVYNATGIRVRDLPTTLDKLLRLRA